MSFPRYPEYKDSGVEWLGEVPAHWDVARFKQIFRERNERSLDGTEELLSVSAYTGVRPRSEMVEDGDHLSRAESLEGYKLCEPGDLVMNIMLAWNRGLGFAWQAGIVSPAYSVFTPSRGDSAKFLDYLVRSDDYTRYFKAFSAGVIDSRLRLYPEVFGRLACCLPPEAEQVAIAAFLDHETAKIDALVDEQKRLIELLKEKRQAVISHAVTKGLDPNVPMKDSGVEWLGEVPAHWEVTKLTFLAVRIGSGKTPRGGAEAYVHDGVMFLRSQNVYDEGLRLEDVVYIDYGTDREMASSRVQPRDILINITGASIGRSCSVPADFGSANVNQHVCVIRLRKPVDLSPWVALQMKASHVKAQVDLAQNGAAREGLNFEQLGMFKICVPPGNERHEILMHVERELEQLDGLLKEAAIAIRLLQERRSALISAAVTGKIDVRDWKPVSSEATADTTTQVTA